MNSLMKLRGSDMMEKKGIKESNEPYSCLLFVPMDEKIKKVIPKYIFETLEIEDDDGLILTIEKFP